MKAYLKEYGAFLIDLLKIVPIVLTIFVVAALCLIISSYAILAGVDVVLPPLCLTRFECANYAVQQCMDSELYTREECIVLAGDDTE